MSATCPTTAVGLRLARIDHKGVLILCKAVRFVAGYAAVETVLLRAAIYGRVEVAGEIANHFADALDDDGDIVATVALDAKSYKALKTRWMPCKVDRVLVPEAKSP